MSTIYKFEAIGTTWQIDLSNQVTNLTHPVSIYDIDLFTNPVSTFTTLHASEKRIICYFSAGSYEPYRPDSSSFLASDKGKELAGWPGEIWLNTSSANVRAIMVERLKLAKQKGCDGVDPDNIDGYDNENGLGLTEDMAVEYLTFLAAEAHGLGMAIGLKNGGRIVRRVVGWLEWEVNEQCVQYGECASFQPFIGAGKPVFGIEYPESAPVVSESTKKDVCGDKDAEGFSTLLKNMDLDEWVEVC